MFCPKSFMKVFYEKCKTFYWKTLEHLTEGTRYILTIDPSKWGRGASLLPVSQSGARAIKIISIIRNW